MLTTDILAIDSTAKEEEIVRSLSVAMEGHMRRVRRGMAVSVVIAVLALAAVALAYVLEKAFYAP
jgi:hypothetical protein